MKKGTHNSAHMEEDDSKVQLYVEKKEFWCALLVFAVREKQSSSDLFAC